MATHHSDNDSARKKAEEALQKVNQEISDLLKESEAEKFGQKTFESRLDEIQEHLDAIHPWQPEPNGDGNGS